MVKLIVDTLETCVIYKSVFLAVVSGLLLSKHWGLLLAFNAILQGCESFNTGYVVECYLFCMI